MRMRMRMRMKPDARAIPEGDPATAGAAKQAGARQGAADLRSRNLHVDVLDL
eukprot:COSAG01_NODE_27158_length_692_cov_17.237774_1_plen_52_part_00